MRRPTENNRIGARSAILRADDSIVARIVRQLRRLTTLVTYERQHQPGLERAETRFKACGFRDSADMLREVQLDAVLIATPDRAHLYDRREGAARR
jgi:predicted dehydrogenase